MPVGKMAGPAGGGGRGYAAIYRNSVTTNLAAAPVGSLLILDAGTTVTLHVSPAVGYWIDVYATNTSAAALVTVGANTFIDNGSNQVVSVTSQSQRIAYVGSSQWVAMPGGGTAWQSGL